MCIDELLPRGFSHLALDPNEAANDGLHLLSTWFAQKRREPIEGAPDEPAEFVENPKWIAVIAEDYFAGDLGLDFYVWIWASRLDVQPRYYIADFRSAVQPNHGGSEELLAIDNLAGDLAVDHRLGRRVHSQRGVRMGEEGGANFPVFVVVRQLRENGQEEKLILACVVTLESLGFLGGLRADVLEEAVALELLGREKGEDGEHDLPCLLVSGFSLEVIYRQLPPEMIEGTTQVVNSITNDEPPVIANLRHSLGDEKDILGLGVVLPPRAEDSRRALPIRCLHNRATDIINVGVRPVELRPASR